MADRTAKIRSRTKERQKEAKAGMAGWKGETILNSTEQRDGKPRGSSEGNKAVVVKLVNEKQGKNKGESEVL